MSFVDWYDTFRGELAKRLGVDYVISIISWTFSEHHKHLFDKGLSPREAALEYIEKNK